jgi:hypothetical protein
MGVGEMSDLLCGCGCGQPLAQWEINQHLRIKRKCSIRQKVQQHQVEIPCNCGCGGFVKTPNDWGQPVRFIFGHGNKGKFGEKSPNWGKGRYTHLRGIKEPCACGKCDKLVEPYKRGSKLRRFYPGHQSRGRRSKRAGTGKCNSLEMIPCKCGCGELRRRYDKSGKERFYIKGHYKPGKPGVMKGRTQPLSQRQNLCDYHLNNPNWKQNFSRQHLQYKGEDYLSAIEIDFAKALDARGIPWEHENRPLPYKDGNGITRNYWPDFFVAEWDKYIEIKKRTWMDKYDSKKMELARKTNPNVVIEVWTEERIRSWSSSGDSVQAA